MANHRTDRMSEDIQREIAAILREMKDPRLHDGIISVVRCDMAKDNRFSIWRLQLKMLLRLLKMPKGSYEENSDKDLNSDMHRHLLLKQQIQSSIVQIYQEYLWV